MTKQTSPNSLTTFGEKLERMTKVHEALAMRIEISSIRDELEAAMMVDDSCETLLHTQARVLDGLFARAVKRSLRDPYRNGQKWPLDRYFSEEWVNVALRAQQQCRQTVQTRAVIRAREEGKKQIKSSTTQNFSANEKKDGVLLNNNNTLKEEYFLGKALKCDGETR